jgi:hypothetical protein
MIELLTARLLLANTVCNSKSSTDTLGEKEDVYVGAFYVVTESGVRIN